MPSNNMKNYLSDEEKEKYKYAPIAEPAALRKDLYDLYEKLADERARRRVPANGLVIMHDKGFSVIANLEELKSLDLLRYAAISLEKKDKIAENVLKKMDEHKRYCLNEVISWVLQEISRIKQGEIEKKIEEQERNPLIEI